MKNKQQVIIVPGGNVFDSYEEYLEFLKNKEVSLEKLKTPSWKDTLPEELGEGYDTVRLKMPNEFYARYSEWKIFFEKYMEDFDDGAILVGHSLGGIFLTKYLAENDFPVKIKALFLIAAPYDHADDGSLGDFVLPENIEDIENKVESIFIYQSTDDFVTPKEEADKYKKALPNAELSVFDNRNHFLDSSLPELTQQIKKVSSV